MVKLSNIKKNVLKYYNILEEQTWITKDYHCVYVMFYNKDIPCTDYTFYTLQEYLDKIEINNEEYDSIQIEYDPITIQFPCSRKSNLCY